MPSALIILSQGAEEMETVISADVLTRGGVSWRANVAIISNTRGMTLNLVFGNKSHHH